MYDHVRLIIADHRQRQHVTTEAPSSYLDAFLKHQRICNDRSCTFTDFQLLRHLCDLFLAGTETTAAALKWLILILLHHPDIQQRMRREIENILGTKTPSLTDTCRKKLPYCDADLYETLRFGNLGPLSLPHGMAEEIRFSGLRIPNEAIIIQCLDSIMMDSQIFKDPSVFNLMRFLSRNGELTGTENVYSFGIGRRVCPGESLTRMEMFLFATWMIQRFEFLPPRDGNIPDLHQSTRETTRSHLPFQLRAIECT